MDNAYLSTLVAKCTDLIKTVMQIQLYGADGSYRAGFRRGTSNKFALHTDIAHILAEVSLNSDDKAMQEINQLTAKRVKYLIQLREQKEKENAID